MRNLYSILGVSRRADSKEIRRAYYALAHRYHPDKHPEQGDAAARFQEGVYAYAVLSQPSYRRLYDRFGSLALQALPLGRAPGRGTALAPLGVMGSLLNGLAAAVQARLTRLEAARARRARGMDEPMAVSVPPSLLQSGGTCTVQARRPGPCAPCRGTGAAPNSARTPCPLCSATGRLEGRMGGLLADPRCPACRGRGHLLQKRCRHCAGSGEAYGYATLTVQVPPGTPRDRPLRVVGRGGIPRRDGGQQGDLLLAFCVVDEPRAPTPQPLSREILP